MDPVTVVATALAAGAAAGLTDTAKEAVVDGYRAVKGLVIDRYGSVEAELVGVENDPEEPLRRQLLARQLDKAGAGRDAGLRAAAEELLRLVSEAEPEAVRAVGVRLSRVDAGGDIEISDVTAAGGSGVVGTDITAAGSVRISGIRAGGQAMQGDSDR
ncbi:hypothetical protein [Nocardia bovistercoris]|uniref:RHIM domain-containing protein n=1 Tax=Nocardia bovistercoris TaxID=2785916 RepID=A0A931MYP7_9NOCA|nr:hypothetical protein [Nocardia bovistercoris]MBH0775265.1 hypothetical protein [Nocardia bovistercoris]